LLQKYQDTPETRGKQLGSVVKIAGFLSWPDHFQGIFDLVAKLNLLVKFAVERERTFVCVGFHF